MICNLPLAAMGPFGTAELLVILSMGLLMALFAVLPFWFICKKAGFTPWLSLVMLVPFGVIALPLIIAFVDWPSLKRQES